MSLSIQTKAVLDFLLNNYQILLAILAAIYTVKQVNEEKKARALPAFLEFEKRIVNDQARKDRGYLYDLEELHLPPKPNEKEILERVCTTFDILGVLVHEELMHQPLIFKPFSDVIIKCWIQVEDFIKYERSDSRKGKTYMLDFEYLVNRAKEYRNKNNYPLITKEKIYKPNQNNSPHHSLPKK